MAIFDKPDWHDNDEDILAFQEEYPDVYDFVLKVLDENCDDAYLQSFKDKFGDDFYDVLIKVIVYGYDANGDIVKFRKNYPDIYKGIIRTIEWERNKKDASYFQDDYPEIYAGLIELLRANQEEEAVKILRVDYPDIYSAIVNILINGEDNEVAMAFQEATPYIYQGILSVLKVADTGLRMRDYFDADSEKDGIETSLPPVCTCLKSYKKGDFIGQQYEVYDVLGEGGFGIVYLVYAHKTKSVCALKTFREEYLTDVRTKERFRKEAQVWINLEKYPYLVRAFVVDEISGRLYIAMEYIAPDEQCLNSLDAYLKHRPPDLAQTLRWAIQFCYGIEYAYSKGICAHRDIKPANILIDQNKNVKISDFGLAGIFQASAVSEPAKVKNDAPMQTAIGTSIGTPEYMSPEQFTDFSACDERSDIYSFGIVLYQMAAGGRLPFSSDNLQYRWAALKHLHHETPVPKLNSSLFPIIRRCLEKEPKRRYQSFKDLRYELEVILKQLTGEIIKLPEQKELEMWEWLNKGYSLCTFGKLQEAIAFFDEALQIDPKYVLAWINKGFSLNNLGKHQEAIACYDKALQIDPKDVSAWFNKGFSFCKLGKLQAAIDSYNKALQINPEDRGVWINKGNSLGNFGRHQEAINCYDKALQINPKDALAWFNKGNSLADLGRHQEAIACYHKAIEIAPRYADPWNNKALAEDKLSRRQDAVRSFKQFLELATEQYTEQIEYARQRLKELEKR